MAGQDAYGRGHADPQREAAALDQLSRVHGAQELQAAVLALLLPVARPAVGAPESPALGTAHSPSISPAHSPALGMAASMAPSMAPSGTARGSGLSPAALACWQAESSGCHGAALLLDRVLALSARARLPCFEQLLTRVARLALPDQRDLLRATRRLMSANGVARPIDRLHWLTMRQQLGAPATFWAQAAAALPIERLPPSDLQAIAVYTAFLSRLVPAEGLQADACDAWYDSAMAAWPVAHDSAHARIARKPPDSDALVPALQRLRGLGWMHRPVLVRCWLEATRTSRLGAPLSDSAADALRLSCTLLDSPLPPDLLRHYEAPAR